MINPVINNLGKFFQDFNSFAQQFRDQNQNVSPQQRVQELLNSGQMSQDDFNQLRNIANQLTGKNY